MAPTNGRDRAPVAVVLPGGGARGAYEIGALSVLLPALEARGERVSLWCGTSVGAINAALFASQARLGAADVTGAAEDSWRTMVKGDVVAPIVGPALPLTALRLLGDALGVPKVHLGGLLDPGPLSRSLDRWVDWLGLARNVRDGVVDAVCVVATSLERGGPVAFVHSRGTIPNSRPNDEIRYVRTPLRSDHLRASAAIPFLFAPVEVRSPHAARGFYSDGATRLNSPIKPALALGAQRVIVIGFEPVTGPRGHDEAARDPHLADVAANVLDGLLLDPVAEDVHRLVTITSSASTTWPVRSTRRAAAGARAAAPLPQGRLRARRSRAARRARPHRRARVRRALRRRARAALPRLRAARPAAASERAQPRRAAVVPLLRARLRGRADRGGQARRQALARAPSRLLVHGRRARPRARPPRARRGARGGPGARVARDPPAPVGWPHASHRSRRRARRARRRRRLAPAAGARTACKSTSAGGRQIKVFIIRGVSCRRANKVAAAYMEFRFPLPYAFRCALTHGNTRYAFTCGHGRRGSDLRDWRQAFQVRDLGSAR